MPSRSPSTLAPRKSPIQARSTASVEAILEATFQVLLATGESRLTTTRVAARAGVSVGTLYQYFPNKSSLLQSVLKRHLVEVAEAVERACNHQKGQTLRQMATALVVAFIGAKMHHPEASMALYSVSSRVDGAEIVQQMSTRINTAIIQMLSSTCDSLATDPHMVALMLQGAMAGVSRRMLESALSGKEIEDLKDELIFLACAYADGCATRSSFPQTIHASQTARNLQNPSR